MIYYLSSNNLKNQLLEHVGAYEENVAVSVRSVIGEKLGGIFFEKDRIGFIFEYEYCKMAQAFGITNSEIALKVSLKAPAHCLLDLVDDFIYHCIVGAFELIILFRVAEIFRELALHSISLVAAG